MGFHDVAFLSSRASVSTTFPKDCGGGVSLITITYLITVVGGKLCHARCEILLLQKSLFLCQSNCMEIIRLLLR